MANAELELHRGADALRIDRYRGIKDALKKEMKARLHTKLAKARVAASPKKSAAVARSVPIVDAFHQMEANVDRTLQHQLKGLAHAPLGLVSEHSALHSE
jgi:hypothetical protein